MVFRTRPERPSPVRFWHNRDADEHDVYLFHFLSARFLELLKKFDDVCGVFNSKENGEVFWVNGREMKAYIDDPRMLPYEIKQAECDTPLKLNPFTIKPVKVGLHG